MSKSEPTDSFLALIRAAEEGEVDETLAEVLAKLEVSEGDEGEDVEILQRDLVEEGLLDQKHANGYVAFLDIFLFFFRWTFSSSWCVVFSLFFKYLCTKTLNKHFQISLLHVFNTS